MSARKVRALPRRSDSPLVTILKRLGCLYCSTCRAFMYPDHSTHHNLAALALDTTRPAGVLPAAVVELVGELEEVTA
jgi:hypothetical protein